MLARLPRGPRGPRVPRLPLWPGTGACRHLATSSLQRLLLDACNESRKASVPLAEWSSADLKDWSQLQGQAERVASWPAHPLEPAERLALAEAFVAQAAGAIGCAPELCGQTLCAFYEALLMGPQDVLCARQLAHPPAPSLVACTAHQSHAVAVAHATALLLAGHVVAVAAPSGSEALGMLEAATAGPLATLPRLRALRSVGPSPSQLWQDRAPPGDFGGDSSMGRHGMAVAAEPFMLSACNTEVVDPRLEHTAELWSPDVKALAQLLPNPSDAVDLEMQQFLHLLWAFRDASEHVALAPGHKHVLLTFCGSVLPEDLVKIAISSAMSPFHERITLHAVGLGPRGRSNCLLREPLNSFCKLVQSGSLTWEVQEHKDWAAFLDWLPEQGPINLFSLLRNLEPELKRRCASKGGAAWVQLTVDPVERLRRWTEVVSADDVIKRRLRTSS
ncbi:unnamed protein product [Cladocopium goreaui]|uniref:149 kDa protein n=1 Tax=Cladocopium goreaui TaxID=2562237 RepID=A0A9P1DQL0_9DINO|nr:unnamed protein product [Cladocopium goreaui]